MRLTERDERRFWEKVALPNEQGCMLWLASTTHDGYPQFFVRGQHLYAHRVAYELLVGPIPEGMELDHVKAKGCTNRHCVAAPDHLEPVTHAENQRRGGAAKTHCINRHLYDEANTYVRPDTGARGCRACRRAQLRAWRERRAAA